MSAGTLPAEVEFAAEEAPRRGGKRVVVLLLLVLLLGGGGAAAWFFVLGGSSEAADTEPQDGVIVSLDPLTTTTGENGLRHARVGVAVVLVDGQNAEVVAPRVALLKDALLREVAGMDADELRSVDGSQRLRDRLSAHAVDIWGEEVVRRVVLTELLVQ